MDAKRIQKSTDDTCMGRVFSKESDSFKKPGMIYCKPPMVPKSIPEVSKISATRIKTLGVNFALLINSSIGVD